ncbi:MAG: serine hydrolase domain-containing protein [Myxococcota bacterium]
MAEAHRVERFRDELRALATERRVAGASLFVVAGESRGGVAVGRGGEHLEPLSVDTPFRIASNTKTFVAFAVARLAELGKLALDASIGSYLPTSLSALLDRRYDVVSMSVAHLMSHSSGLRCHTDDPRFVADILDDPRRRWTREEQVMRAVALGDPWDRPGRTAVYSDTGYVLLGAIIEELTGDPLGPALRSLVDFENLGLSQTWFERSEVARSSLDPVHQYVGSLNSVGWDPSMDLFGGGGLISTVQDLARFYSALPSSSVFPILTATQVLPSSTPIRSGLFEERAAGHAVFSHAGYWGTFAAVVPDRNIAVAAMVNQRDAAGSLEELVRAIILNLIGDL